ncbi:MAG: hypothetical protein ABIJ85_03670 [bacterium]
MKKYLIDKKNQLILLLCALFLMGALRENARFIFWVLGGVLVAAAADTLIKYFFFKQKIFPKSAVISGCIVSGIINYQEPWYVLCFFCVLAIVSKNVIKYKKQHIFNPANFALFAATLFKIPLTWNIESNIYVIIAFGLYMAYSIKKIPHVLGFLLFFSVPLLIGQINPLLMVSWFFVFIMLIEPKTSGFGRVRGFVFGGITGLSAFLIMKYSPSYDLFVSALFIANLLSPVLKMIKK